MLSLSHSRVFHHLLWPHLRSVRVCSRSTFYSLKAWRTASLYLSPRMAALLGSSLPPFQPSTVLDSVPAHGRALLHRLPLTRCQSLVRRHAVPARLPLCSVSCAAAMFSLAFRGESNFIVPFSIALASCLIYSARQLPVVESCLSLVCIENVRQRTIYSHIRYTVR